ncbi:MAG: DinB family protein, partial [Bacteroidota bacterium]
MTKKVEQQLEQLHGDLIKLLKDLEGYSEARLNEQPKPGQWSVFQIMHHLILAEGYSMQYVERKLSHQPKLKNSTPITGLRKVIITSYLKSPLKRNAPTG